MSGRYAGSLPAVLAIGETIDEGPFSQS